MIGQTFAAVRMAQASSAEPGWYCILHGIRIRGCPQVCFP
jgi:hypothetical protein